MASIDFEYDLTDVEREAQAMVHRFAEEQLRPAGQALDKLHDPQDVIKEGSLLWQMFDKYDELGLSELNMDDSGMPGAAQARLQSIILEELAWGDAGIALAIACRGMGRMYSMLSGQPDLIERYAAPGNKEVGCWAITEPDHGSDTLAMTEDHFRDPSLKANCVARKVGDEYVIQGQKSSWVSDGPIATLACLFLTIEGDRGFEGGGVALVPLDLDGVSKGKPLDKIGQRALPQGEIFFDEAKIPARYMIADQDSYAQLLRMQLTLANAFMGVSFSGVARSAYDLANEYAKERVQGGKPINQHQSVKLRLFDMFRRVETASAFSRKVQLYNTATGNGKLHYSIAAKTYATRVAFDVASEAVQIFGGNGLSREYPIEKIMRDARSSMIEDGCNEVLSIVGAASL